MITYVCTSSLWSILHQIFSITEHAALNCDALSLNIWTGVPLWEIHLRRHRRNSSVDISITISGWIARVTKPVVKHIQKIIFPYLNWYKVVLNNHQSDDMLNTCVTLTLPLLDHVESTIFVLYMLMFEKHHCVIGLYEYCQLRDRSGRLFSVKAPDFLHFQLDLRFLIYLYIAINWRKYESLKKAQHGRIENVAGSVWLSLFMDGTVKCKLPSTPGSTGLSRIQHLTWIGTILNFETPADVSKWRLSWNLQCYT
jgi:hypothetical protein